MSVSATGGNEKKLSLYSWISKCTDVYSTEQPLSRTALTLVTPFCVGHPPCEGRLRPLPPRTLDTHPHQQK